MAQIKNVSGVDKNDAWSGRFVLPGQVIPVSDDHVWAYLAPWAEGQEGVTWAPGDPETQDLIDAEYEKRNPTEDAEPKGSASRDEWVAFVLSAGLATAEELADMKRDEIRDTYKKES